MDGNYTTLADVNVNIRGAFSGVVEVVAEELVAIGEESDETATTDSGETSSATVDASATRDDEGGRLLFEGRKLNESERILFGSF